MITKILPALQLYLTTYQCRKLYKPRWQIDHEQGPIMAGTHAVKVPQHCYCGMPVPLAVFRDNLGQ